MKLLEKGDGLKTVVRMHQAFDLTFKDFSFEV